ncbi:MAG: hypothetical protein IPG64_11485 [Haliea sp.]|nr:hypothetical protein [Haliea sp.]
MSKLFASVSCLVLVYPFIVLYGLQVLPLQQIGLFFIALASLRLLFLRSQPKNNLLPILLSLVLLLIAAHALMSNESNGLRFYPVAVNAVLLFVFATSLRSETPIIERLARISDPHLPPRAVEYTRKVTVVWCLFFVINGLIALYTALFSSFQIWALYNGAVAYGLTGLLFVVELIVRRKVKWAANGSA